MKDFLGNNISVGDRVVGLLHFSTSSQLAIGTVKELKPKTLIVDLDKRRSFNHPGDRRFNPDKVVVVEPRSE